jgi:hypothetical protein
MVERYCSHFILYIYIYIYIQETNTMAMYAPNADNKNKTG